MADKATSDQRELLQEQMTELVPQQSSMGSDAPNASEPTLVSASCLRIGCGVLSVATAVAGGYVAGSQWAGLQRAAPETSTLATEKENISMVVCGAQNSGKTTTIARLLSELGDFGLGGKRERGITITNKTMEFSTTKFDYTIIDSPGHRDFIKNMITGESQADVALLLVPADGNFTGAIAKGNHKAGEVQGGSRQHARLIYLLGVKQLIVGVSKMDSETAKYSQLRFEEVAKETKNMLIEVGWNKQLVDNSVPYLPISGYTGDNILKPSTNMEWWEGQDVSVGKDNIHVVTLLDALDKMCRVPPRPTKKPMRLPVSGVYKIPGVGDIVAGSVMQGVLEKGEKVIFVPTHTAANPCTGMLSSVQMHHRSVDSAGPGDNVGVNVSGLEKHNMPRVGDVMIYKKDATLGRVRDFKARVHVLDIPGEFRVGYTPFAYVAGSCAPCRMSKLIWKEGKETGGKRMEAPRSLKSNEMAEVCFQPQQPMVVDSFRNCEGLSRVAFMDGIGVVMVGKVVSFQKA